MPELPEVQTIVNDLRPLLLKKSIAKLEVLDNRLNQLSQPEQFNLIIHQTISDLSRRAKNLVISLANGHYLVIHLKMTGQLIWQADKKWLAGGHPTKDLADSAQPLWPNKATRAIISLSDNSRLFFNDTRKFGWLKLMDQEQWTNYQRHLGIEPLDKNFSLTTLTNIIQKRPRSIIKSLLLDQSQIVGLGNIYVDESLFVSNISPLRRAGSLKPSEITKLHRGIINILKQAILNRGTSFSDYRDGRGQRGNFSQQLQVYGRGHQSCLKCGQPIAKIKLVGRGTHYCTNCQK